MCRPEYLVAYFPYTEIVSRYYKVVGDRTLATKKHDGVLD